MGTTNYTWNPLTDSVIEESDGSGNTIVTYTNEPTQFGPLVSENRGGTTSYYHFDALGSTRLTTNSSQAVVDTFTYDAWGNTVASTGTTPPPYLWCGKWGYQTDAVLGTAYARARTYQPTVARWSSIDPLSMALKAKVTNAFLIYVYGSNCPSRIIDPTGWAPPPPPPQPLIQYNLTNSNYLINMTLFVWPITLPVQARPGLFNPLTNPDEVWNATEEYYAAFIQQMRLPQPNLTGLPDENMPLLPELVPDPTNPLAVEAPGRPIMLEPPDAETNGIGGLLLFGTGTVINPLTGNPLLINGRIIQYQPGIMFGFQLTPGVHPLQLDPHTSWLVPLFNISTTLPTEPPN